MCSDPPLSNFHELFRIVVLVREESIEGQTNRLAFLFDFFITYCDDLLPQTWSHGNHTSLYAKGRDTNDNRRKPIVVHDLGWGRLGFGRAPPYPIFRRAQISQRVVVW